MTSANCPTYAEIASSFELWWEYVDPYRTFSEEEFEAMSFEKRIALIVKTYGPVLSLS